jgi:hypothetical protein
MAKAVLTPEQYARLAEQLTAATTGSMALPGVFPAPLREVGYHERPAEWHHFLGSVLSWPPCTSDLIVGVSHDDVRGRGTDEDIYHVRGNPPHIVTPYPKSAYERVDRRYAGTHRGPKDYLRRPSGPE